MAEANPKAESSAQTEIDMQEPENKPLIGKWVDEAKRWYDGSVIEIKDDGKWKPVKPKQKVHQRAQYTAEVVSDTEWILIELREEDERREFRLRQDEKTKMLEVQLRKPDGSLAEMKWTLEPYDESRAAQRRRIQDLVKPTSGHVQRDRFRWECTWEATVHNSSTLVNHTAFDIVVGIVILCNSILIGVEIDMSIKDEPPEWIDWVDNFFLFFYVVELSLRFISRGLAYLKDSWGILDTTLVTVGLLCVPVKLILQSRGEEQSWLLKRIMIFRIIRLVKVLQPVRTFEIMQPLWKLINGLSQAMGTLASTFLVIIFVLYIFACIGGEVIAQNKFLLSLDPDHEARKVVEEKFSGLWVIMLTLIQFTTADITDIYFPLVTEMPWLAIYFGLAYLVITILLMNLVTAVLVEDAIARSSEDIKMKTRKTRRKLDQFVPQLEAVFDAVDHDNTGDINLTELAQFVPRDDMELDNAVKEVMKPETLEECYECFDADNSGLVSKEEFVQGALAVLLKDAPQELTQLLQLVRASNKQLIAIQDRLNAMEYRVGR